MGTNKCTGFTAWGVEVGWAWNNFREGNTGVDEKGKPWSESGSTARDLSPSSIPQLPQIWGFISTPLSILRTFPWPCCPIILSRPGKNKTRLNPRTSREILDFELMLNWIGGAGIHFCVRSSSRHFVTKDQAGAGAASDKSFTCYHGDKL